MTGCEKSPRSPQPAAARVLDVGEQFRGLAGPPWPRGALRPEKMHFPRTGEREPARAAGRAPGAPASAAAPNAATSPMFCAFSDTHEIHRVQLTAPACGYPMIGAAVTTLDIKMQGERKPGGHSGLHAPPGALVVEAARTGGQQGRQGGRQGWSRACIGPARGVVVLKPVSAILFRRTRRGSLTTHRHDSTALHGVENELVIFPAHRNNFETVAVGRGALGLERQTEFRTHGPKH